MILRHPSLASGDGDFQRLSGLFLIRFGIEDFAARSELRGSGAGRDGHWTDMI